MNELFNIKDQVVVITGGTGVLGRCIAKYLAKEGAKVVVMGRKAETVGTAMKSCTTGEKAVTICYLTYVILCSSCSHDCSGAAILPQINIVLGIERYHTTSCRA